MELYKTCRLCLKELPESRFYRYRRKYNGGFRTYLSYRCFDCHAKKNLEYYYDNHEQRKEHDAVYRKKHRLERNRYNRQYRRNFVSPKYKAKDMQPRVDFSVPSPSPED